MTNYNSERKLTPDEFKQLITRVDVSSLDIVKFDSEHNLITVRPKPGIIIDEFEPENQQPLKSIGIGQKAGNYTRSILGNILTWTFTVGVVIALIGVVDAGKIKPLIAVLIGIVYFALLFGVPRLISWNRQLDERMKSIKDSPESWCGRGMDYYEASDYQKAVECFQEALKRNPEYVQACYNLGLTLDNCKRYDQALQCYNRTLELKPTHPNAWNNKGVILYRRGERQEAIECYEKAISYGSKDAEHNLEIIHR